MVERMTTLRRETAQGTELVEVEHGQRIATITKVWALEHLTSYKAPMTRSDLEESYKLARECETHCVAAVAAATDEGAKSMLNTVVAYDKVFHARHHILRTPRAHQQPSPLRARPALAVPKLSEPCFLPRQRSLTLSRGAAREVSC